jgi:hypothetical protein
MNKKQISFLEGENKIKIGHELFMNSHDTEQWVSLMDYEIEVTKTGDNISLGIHKADEWNYDSKHLLFTIQMKETAQ